MEPAIMEYLHDSLVLSEKEMALRAEFSQWLPPEIIDCHAHANGKDVVRNLSNVTLKRVHSSFPYHSIQDSISVLHTLYLSQRPRLLRFANPYKGIDHRSANKYLLENSPSTDRVALTGIPDDVSYTLDQLNTGRYAALKMYLYYFEPPATKIIEYFPLPILVEAQQLSIPIILHTPKSLFGCIDELLGIIDQFPRLNIVLAHVGRHTSATRESFAAYQKLASHHQVTVDTSMATSSEIFEQVLELLGPNRVLFGTDEPFNLLRYVRYQHPDLGDRLVSTYPYRWLDEKQRQEYGHLANGAVHIHWQSLDAIRSSIMKSFPNRIDEVKRLIFHDNAQRVFSLFEGEAEN